MNSALEAKDLRVNNLVLFKGKPFQLLIGADLDNLSDKEPILLSPEILIGCGFISNGEDMYFIPLLSNDDTYDRVELIISIEGERWDQTHAAIFVQETDLNDETWLHPKAEIKYLHQLQNFYYFHTGQELKTHALFSFNAN